MRIQLTHLSYDDCENACTLSNYHQQIRNMTRLSLFRVRSWNNGMRWMTFYILIARLRHPFASNRFHLSSHLHHFVAITLSEWDVSKLKLPSHKHQGRRTLVKSPLIHNARSYICNLNTCSTFRFTMIYELIHCEVQKHELLQFILKVVGKDTWSNRIITLHTG